jgi:hypothetical protein
MPVAAQQKFSLIWISRWLHPLGFPRIYRWPRIAVSDGGLRAG